jgi:hypothetical protein
MTGIPAAAAGAPLAQTKGPDVERVGQDVGVQQHAVRGNFKAESAAGVGETDGKDHQTDERDADGRLPWHLSREEKDEASSTAADAPLPPSPPNDPGGAAGNLLDLSG